MMIYTLKQLSLLGVACILCSPSFAHEGHGSKEPWDACATTKIHDQCSFSNADGDIYQGTCKKFNDALMCVRNRPIIRAKKVNKNISNVISKLKDTELQGTEFKVNKQQATN